ncbi:hypothetical protein K7X08_012281 [Anisodus acutangulus]|uniref:Uncharacterized protein n=1 Tax=Anisodus acutangulus TaxID=402998 RepID=A0A9Q1R081_9SOLA|nr:hypothetical protein K7X08_012281 [Anisodus acutangulus]
MKTPIGAPETPIPRLGLGINPKSNPKGTPTVGSTLTGKSVIMLALATKPAIGTTNRDMILKETNDTCSIRIRLQYKRRQMVEQSKNNQKQAVNTKELDVFSPVEFPPMQTNQRQQEDGKIGQCSYQVNSGRSPNPPLSL